MNEQQLADIFSEQLDLLLQEQPVDLPAEAAELQDLLGLGHQFTQVQFQPSAAAQAAFQGQLASWGTTGSGIPSAATWLGIPKNLVAIMLIAGGGLGLVALLGLTVLLAGGDSPAAAPDTPALNVPVNEEYAPPPETMPPSDDEGDAGDGPNQKSQQSSDQLPGRQSDNSAGDTIETSPSGSVGDTLPVPTTQAVITSTATITPANTPAVGIAPPVDGSVNSDDTNPPDQPAVGGDDDRGHGNDPGGYDPDNPGNSTGVGGGQDNAPNLGGGSENSGGSPAGGGGSNNSGGGGNSSNNGKAKGKDK